MSRTLRPRSSAGQPRPQPPDDAPRFVRTPNGTINNCSLANGEPERDCQICAGECPDRDRFSGAAKSGYVGISRGGPNSPDRIFDGTLAAEREEQEAGERAFAEAAGGEYVEVTWGREQYQPLPYNGCEVGALKVVVRLAPGEKVADAIVRVHRELADAARVVRKEKFAEYLRELAGFVSKAKQTEVP